MDTSDTGAPPTDKVLVALIDITEAKRLRSLLETKGVALELISNPETCRCGPGGSQVEVYVDESGVPAFKALVGAERARLLEGLPANASPGDSVVDFDKSEATCPACSTVFSTSAAECPECGLGFSGPTGLESALESE